MPILLTTPHKGYAEVKAVPIRIGIERRHLFVTFQHGDTVEGAWVAGHLQQDEKLIRNLEQLLDGEGGELRAADPQYNILVAGSTATAADEAVPGDGGFNCYAATARNIYEYAIAQEWFEGTVA